MDESVKRNAGIGVIVLILVVVVWRVWGAIGGDDVTKTANTITYIDVETEELFQIRLSPDMPGDPQENPKTGNRTLRPAEMCYWDECGTRGGTAVLRNTYRGEEEPTHCPVCGHRVTFRNPAPPDYPPMDE